MGEEFVTYSRMCWSDRVTRAGKLITVVRRCKFYAYAAVWDETRSEIPSSIIIRSLCNLPQACGPRILYRPTCFGTPRFRSMAFGPQRVRFPKPGVPWTFLILLNALRPVLVRLDYACTAYFLFARDVLRFTHVKSRYNAFAPAESTTRTGHFFRVKSVAAWEKSSNMYGRNYVSLAVHPGAIHVKHSYISVLSEFR